MEVPLSGSPFDRMRVAWDPSDPSHAKEVYLYADVPPSNDAAIKSKIASLLGARVNKNGGLYFQGVFFNYDMTSARAAAELKDGSAPNPHWKPQVDASWDLVRNAVLGLGVPVTDVDLRDWLGRGYTLTAIGAIDVTVDVDHSTATMQAAFPGVESRQVIGLEHTIAVDSPWFGEAELDWENAKNGHLTRVLIRPPPSANNEFSNQADIDACVQAIVGGKGKRSEEDHLKGTYDTEWKPADGGEVRVYGHMVAVTLGGDFVSKKMTKGGYQKVMDGLDACGKKK
jgi:hypothetical protein